MEPGESNDNIILDIDTETKEPLVRVHPDIAVKLKPHQVGAESQIPFKDYSLRPRKNLPKTAYLCGKTKRKVKLNSKGHTRRSKLKKILYSEKVNFSDPIENNNNLENETSFNVTLAHCEFLNEENPTHLCSEKNSLIHESDLNLSGISNLNLFNEFLESQINIIENNFPLTSSAIQINNHELIEVSNILEKNISDTSLYENSNGLLTELNEQSSINSSTPGNENDGSDFTTISKIDATPTISLKNYHPHCCNEYCNSSIANDSTNQNNCHHNSNDLIQPQFKNQILNQSNHSAATCLEHKNSHQEQFCCSASNSFSSNSYNRCQLNEPSISCNNCHCINKCHSNLVNAHLQYCLPSLCCSNKVVILMH